MEILNNIIDALLRQDRWKMYVNGILSTLRMAAVACVIGILIGLVVAVVKIYAAGSRNPVLKILSAVANIYTTVIRGTPIVVQLLILFSLPKEIIADATMACYVGFSINSGAYVSEVFRGGINSVDIGQMEAGRSLGLSRNRSMLLIVLPQAIKNILPSLFNEFIMLVKETSVAGYIGAIELTKVADGLKGVTFDPIHLYIAALVYLTMVFVLTMVQRLVERRLGKSDRR